jgi:hypothetical protein
MPLTKITFADWLHKYEKDTLMGITHFGIQHLSNVSDDIDYFRVSKIITSKIDTIAKAFEW